MRMVFNEGRTSASTTEGWSLQERHLESRP